MQIELITHFVNIKFFVHKNIIIFRNFCEFYKVVVDKDFEIFWAKLLDVLLKIL